MSTSDADGVRPPLAGMRVVDLSSWIGGGYCTKLLTDGGAEVVKVESGDGDPLRRWSASGAPIVDSAHGGIDAGLFNYLHASQRSVLLTPGAAGVDDLHSLLAVADVVVWSHGPVAHEPPPVTVAEILARHPHLLVGAITPFGLDTPWEGRAATEYTLQAWSGGMVRINRGHPHLPPAHVGGQVGEWMSGLYCAIGVLAARRRGEGGVVDVSMLEVAAATLTYYPVTFHDQLGRPIREDRFVPTPGVTQALDGTVGLGTGTGQQWLDFCAMVGRPDWMDEPAYFVDRTVLAPEIAAWAAERTVAEICDLATAFRLPNAPVVDGATATEAEHVQVRNTFVRNPRDGAINPRPPCRFEHVAVRPQEPAPALGADSLADVRRSFAEAPRPVGARRSLPLEGLRVLDMTAFWAGPLTGHLLALLGAEVIHLESESRPDGARLVGGVPQTTDRFLERGPIFSALNTNKKSLSIDTRSPAGVALLREVLATCDVLVENFTPRVLENLGLDANSLAEVNPRLITVRMPGFGLDGPWRDVAAFAFVIEDAAGFTWLTGHPEAVPSEPYCIGDPNAGLHALFGLQLALEHRDRTGQGGLVEAAMLDAALNVTAEQVIEHSRHGVVLQRAGNRGPMAAPQNAYQVVGPDEYGRDDCWVAIAVATDEQWSALVDTLGRPHWALAAELVTADGRRRHQEEIDAHLREWCRPRTADEVVGLLWPAGVPVAPVLQPHRQVDLAPLHARSFFESLDHPVIGTARYSTLPMRMPGMGTRLHHRHAPLLGEHTDEVLRAAGVTPDRIAALAAEGVIGGTST